MESVINIEESQMQGVCPVCGTSWLGITRAYCFFSLLRANHPRRNVQRLKKLSLKIDAPEAHLSRLQHIVNDEIHICPDCGTHIKVNGYKYKQDTNPQ